MKRKKTENTTILCLTFKYLDNLYTKLTCMQAHHSHHILSDTETYTELDFAGFVYSQVIPGVLHTVHQDVCLFFLALSYVEY